MDVVGLPMNLAGRITKYVQRGFTKETAEVNVLIEYAAFAIFRNYPDAFVLFGGATLVLFHESVRHSADLDLLALGTSTPARAAIVDTLRRELVPVAHLLQLGQLSFEDQGPGTQEGSIYVSSVSRRRLFRLDLTKLGSAIHSEIEAHSIETHVGEPVVVKSATRELLLLQKAEAFLLRKIVKARDAYDIYILSQRGTTLSPTLQAHLADSIHANEIDSTTILERITSIDIERCRLELKPTLPSEIYTPFENNGFEEFKITLKALYEEWL